MKKYYHVKKSAFRTFASSRKLKYVHNMDKYRNDKSR